MDKKLRSCMILLSAALFTALSLAESEARETAIAGRSQAREWQERSSGLLNALIQVESSGNPLAWEKNTGARGLAQIRPVAWMDLAARFPEKYRRENYYRDIFRPEVAYEAGKDYLEILAEYLRRQGYPPTVDNLLCAYNWGIGNFLRYGLKNAPQETKSYIRQIKQLLAR